ncbi:hypothetical protein [Caballeronia sp. AZ7_KS35]|uniref:hypothetical protein n=1 Tax=Caballeronia sp. AZ7_KS35 TaxID=2921762 RepID=UPI002028E6C9|nr:hypothetical protein [Caballeronia sp. AZ7_KS35]
MGNKDLTISWTDIVLAAVTAGKPGALHLLAHRSHSLANLVVRTHALYANLQQREQKLDRSSLYDSLDPTEKGATSYFLGMAMAKLFAAPLFATPWLFHVSMASGLGTTLCFKLGSKSQPDLLGKTTSGEWIIVEAKGRTKGLDLHLNVDAAFGRYYPFVEAITGRSPSRENLFGNGILRPSLTRIPGLRSASNRSYSMM